MNELLERLQALSDEERRSLLAFMAGRNTQTLGEAIDAWERDAR